MVKSAVIGLGKMGMSHLAILNAHPDTNVIGVCDSSSFLTGCMGKVTDLSFYSDYNKMLDQAKPDAVMIATPSSSHFKIVSDCLDRGIHVFVEKPFTLNVAEGEALVKSAEGKKLINQVGYHNKFVGAFNHAKKLIENNAIGEIYAIHGEAYGPVVLKAKGSTWRSKKIEGGGCLHDYASHVIDLMNQYVGVPSGVGGTILQKIFSKDVEDAVYASLFYESGISGQLSINWSEPTYRKMSTIITIQGIKGKIIVDRQECKVYLNEPNKNLNLESGWQIFYTTELTNPVWFYLRGEEYSAQIDYFINCITGKDKAGTNSFSSALETDKVVELLSNDAESKGK